MPRLILALLLALGLAPQLSAQQRVDAGVPTSPAEIKLTFAPIVKSAAPAVVNIHTSQTNERTRGASDPFLNRFFGAPRQRRGTALGSGVVVDPAGLVVTNAHVVGDARELRVNFNDRREYVASLLLKDDRTDLAVLRIDDPGPFPTVTLGDADTLEVGDLVLAIGNPFGVGQTVTQGIVSAVARTQVGVADYRFFIQTDAAINPGNSGGALIDMAGRLVGINTAIYSRSGGSHGIGFAIPADMVEVVVNSAREGRSVQRPWFGARLQTMTRDLARQYGLDRPTGALIVNVYRESPALRAGIRVGDIIVGVDQEPVPDHDTFGYLFATRGISGSADVAVLRGGERRIFKVALEGPPETVARDARRIRGRSPFGGSIVMNLSPKVADELSLELSAEGVAIARVDQRSIAERVGLKAGDIILEVNGRSIDTTAVLERTARRRSRYWDIIIVRGGEQISLVLGG
ncbi:MAG: Do family serine endopeptidase [Pseudomonadota bacterium]